MPYHYQEAAYTQIQPSTVAQQFAPFAVLFTLLVLPLLVLNSPFLLEVSFNPGLALKMVLEYLNLDIVWNGNWNFPWSSVGRRENVGQGRSRTGGISSKSNREQLTRPDDSTGTQVASSESLYFPGLVNISGTYCFMNSNLQSFASLSYLIPYIEAIRAKAEKYDVPTPVVDCLFETVTHLNTPLSYYSSLRPTKMIATLSAPAHPYYMQQQSQSQSRNRSLLFSSREHQDAQELFQLLSSLVKEEAVEVDREATAIGLRVGSPADRDATPSPFEPVWEVGKSVFEGLTANRRSCVECGYTEAVMHFPFNSIQLAMPNTSSCSLQELLEDYTRLELLTDCICRKCSLLATHRKLLVEVERLSAPSMDNSHEGMANGNLANGHHGKKTALPAESHTTPSPTMTASKKKRLRETKKLERIVKAALDEGRIEDDLGIFFSGAHGDRDKTHKSVKLEKVYSKASTKQVMIARPPPVLALHLNRSSYNGYGHASKNLCRIAFPEFLDLTPFTTSGRLSTSPSLPISSHASSSSPIAHFVQRSLQESPAIPPEDRVIYRLSSIICHYGAHSFGHYVSYRRKPRPPPPNEQKENSLPHVRFEPPALDEIPAERHGGWLRVSDDAVDEVGVERVLSESSGIFMAFYERVTTNVIPIAEGSKEDVSAANRMSASVPSLSSLNPYGARGRARIVRSVLLGRNDLKSSVLGQTSMPKSQILETLSERQRKSSFPTYTQSPPSSSSSSSPSSTPSFDRSSSMPIPVPTSQSSSERDIDEDAGYNSESGSETIHPLSSQSSTLSLHPPAVRPRVVAPSPPSSPEKSRPRVERGSQQQRYTVGLRV